MSICKPLQPSQPLVCDPSSAYLQDFCTTICRGNNDSCCVDNCANGICTAESDNGAGSITGYLWGLGKALYRVNAAGLNQLPTVLRDKSKNLVFVTGILIFVPIWILFTVLLLILAAIGLITWTLFFLGTLIGFIVVALFAMILFLYLDNEVASIERDIGTILRPYFSPEIGTQIVDQFTCVPAPQFPC